MKLFLVRLSSEKRSEIIATYALCGFSNIPGIGIQMAALGSIVPEKRHKLAQVALSAMINGSVACFSTACVAGKVYSIFIVWLICFILCTTFMIKSYLG